MSMIGTALAAAIDDAGWRRAPAADPDTVAAWLALLRPLYAAGRRDLPVARLLEGHADAVQIVLRYGSTAQAEALRAAVATGATLGVWNAALADEPLDLADGRLDGGKSFASGAGILSHALVTARTAAGTQLLLLDLAGVPPAIDRDWWHVDGMQRSETHRVRWRGAAVSVAATIGTADDYPREPFFSGGALRFVAVHAGGVAGVLDRVRDDLVARGRADDPFQAARLADLFRLAETAADAVRRAARGWFEREGEARLALVASTRLTVTDAAERAIAIARRAVGVDGHFVAHPLSAHLSDLAVYLRQPGPDAQRLRIGRAVAAGLLAATL